MSQIPIKSLNDKDIVQDRIFLVKDKVLGVGKNGKSFLTVLVGDQTGQIDGRIWDNIEEVQSRFDIGDLIKVKGVIQIYNQRKQLILHRLDRIIDPSINKDEFKIKERSIDVHALYSELIQIVQQIEIHPLRQLVIECLQDEDVKSKLLKAPAAKTIHHAHRGGLIEHIISICKIMQFMAAHYSFLNKDLLIFGAVFHDLGKIWELAQNEQQQIYYTPEGQLLGHMLLSCELIEKKSQRILGFPDDLRMILKHIVLAHHGKLEYGSPKVPMFPEAMLVAMIDDLDSKIDTMMGFVNQERQSGESWSRYNEHFERYFYLDDLKNKWKVEKDS